MPSSARCTRSASWPRTTTSGLTPAFDTRPTTQRTSVSPSSSMRSLFCPMRVDVPAASTMPAIDPCAQAWIALTLAEVSGLVSREESSSATTLMAICSGRRRQGSDRPARTHADRHARRAGRECHRLARADQAGRCAAGRETLQPVAIVSERMGHDDDQRARVDAQIVHAGFGSSAKEALCQRKAAGCQKCLPMIHDRHGKPRLGRI